MRSNLWKLTAVSALREALFLIPVVVPFLEENGLTLQKIFLLQGIFAAALVVLEIPTGYIADRWGRKSSLVASGIIGTGAIFIYASSSSFAGFILAEVLLAVCFSLQSGTIDAMLYETLAVLGLTKDYRREAGKRRFYGHVTQAAASILGGAVALISLRLTLWLTLVPYLLSFAAALLLKEPPRQRSLDGSHLQQVLQIGKRVMARDSVIRDIIMLFSVMATLTLSLVWFGQAYQTLIGLPLWLFGVVHSVIAIGVGLAAKFAHLLEKWMDDRLLLLIASGVIVASYLGLGFMASAWGLLLFFLGRTMYGFFGTVTTDIVNRLTTSDVRATVLSLQSFGNRLLFVAVSPVIGYLADTKGLSQSFFIVGIVGGLTLGLIFLLMRKVWSRIPA